MNRKQFMIKDGSPAPATAPATASDPDVETLKRIFESKRDEYKKLGKEVLDAKLKWQNALAYSSVGHRVMKINVQVMSPNFPQTITFDVKASDTITSLKAKIQEMVDIPPQLQILALDSYRGEELHDADTVSVLEDGCTIFLGERWVPPSSSCIEDRWKHRCYKLSGATH